MEIILEAKDIVKQFKIKREKIMHRPEKMLTAVDHVSVKIPKKRTIGIVGESGSGKSTLAEIIGDLQRPTAGVVEYYGKNIRTMSRNEYRRFRRNVQFIFQHAKESLNPYFTVEEVLLEPLKLWNEPFHLEESREEIKGILEKVHLPEKILHKYPGELSGGQAQRVAIARSLLLRPEIIICDEAVSALDVSVQKQILDLLKDLQQEFEMSYLFITHDMGVVNYIADEIIVMKNGRVIEAGEKNEVLFHPQEDYTKTLISSSFMF